MTQIANFPFFELEFDKFAAPVQPEQITEVLDGITNLGLTDLVIISHGWNNDMDEARRLYIKIMTLLDTELNRQNKKFGVLGIFWPSKKFAEKDLIPGGAAGIDPKENDAIIEQAAKLKGFFDSDDADEHLQTIQDVLELEKTGDAEEFELLDALNKLFGPITDNPSPQPDEDAIADFKKTDMGQLLIRLDVPEDEPLPEAGSGGATDIDGIIGVGGADGASAGIGSFLSGIKNGLFNILNLATYYQMKDRAGKVGMQALNPIIHKIQDIEPDIRLHLVGHSFGARLVTASIAGEKPEDAVFVQSLILLQAAFSHYGFAVNYIPGQNGLFRRVIEDGNIKGIMVVSHSIKDKAVGYAYPLASRVARQIAAAFGGKDDPYGGLGANGALKSGAIDTINMVLGSQYDFNAGAIYNLDAETTISGHGDIDNKAVAEVISAVINL